MTQYRKKLFYTSFVMFCMLECIAVFVIYSHAVNLVRESALTSNKNDSQFIAINIDSMYDVAKKKMEIITNELSQTVEISHILETNILSEKSDIIKNLNYSLFSRLTTQTELTAFYIVTDTFISGYDISNNDSFYVSYVAPHIWTKSPSEDVFLLLSQNMTKLALVPQKVLISQIVPGQYLVGVINLEKLSDSWNDRLIIFNKDGISLYTNPYPVTAELLSTVANTSKPVRIVDQTYLVSIKSLNDFELSIYVLSNTKDIADKLSAALLSTFYFAFLITAIHCAVMFFLSKKIVSAFYHFNSIVNAIQRYEDVHIADDFIRMQKRTIRFQQKVFFYYIVNFIPLILSILFFSGVYSRVDKNDTLNAYSQAITHTAQEINYTLKSHSLYINYIALNKNFQNILINSLSGTDNSYKDINNLLLYNQTGLYNIYNLKVYDSFFKLIFSSTVDENELAQTSIDYLKQNTGFTLWLSSPDHISIVKRISYLPQPSQLLPYFTRLGYLAMDIDAHFLSIANMINDGFQCIVDDTGQIIDIYIQGNYSPDAIQEFIFNNQSKVENGKLIKYNESDMYFSNINISNTSWTYLSCVLAVTYSAKNTQLIFFSIISFLALFIILNQASRIFAQKTLQPIRHLQDYMKNMDSNQIPLFNSEREDNEFVSLANNFREMLIRLNILSTQVQHSIAENAEFEKRKNEAQFVALQTQIDPHFLNNIFASITMLLKMSKTDDAIRMLQTTGKLFRIGIYRGENIVHISEELDHVLAYIELQKIRYRDRISVSIDISDELKMMKMPKLILQPLVENAIEHNLKVQKAVQIHIRFIIGEELTIIICDNGVGLRQDDLISIRERLAHSTYAGHVGLVNINERIRLYFGDLYGLKIESNLDSGTCVYVVLPLLND